MDMMDSITTHLTEAMIQFRVEDAQVPKILKER